MKRSQAFFNVDLEGLEQLEKKLLEMPIRARNKGLRNALTKAVLLVEEEAIRLAPIGKVTHGWMAFLDDPSHPKLKDNIVHKVFVSRLYAWGRVGIDYTKVRHGHLIEFGTDPHFQKKLKFIHPGIEDPKPFMTPAYENKGELARNVMANELYDSVMGNQL